MKKQPKLKTISTEGYYYLKWIAIIAMMICHVTNVFEPYWNPIIVTICRYIGRISFPIFCWQLVECAKYKYFCNMGFHGIKMLCLAIISEAPYDIVMFGEITWDRQNVIFELLLGWILISVSMNIKYGIFKTLKNQKTEITLNQRFVFASLQLGAALIACLIAEVLSFEYWSAGIMMIYIIFFTYFTSRTTGDDKIQTMGPNTKTDKIRMTIIILIFILAMSQLYDTFIEGLLTESGCLLALPIIWFCQHKKFKEREFSTVIKYISSAFYPLHLILLALIRYFIA